MSDSIVETLGAVEVALANDIHISGSEIKNSFQSIAYR